jgi:hypothetical protein
MRFYLSVSMVGGANFTPCALARYTGFESLLNHRAFKLDKHAQNLEQRSGGWGFRY